MLHQLKTIASFRKKEFNQLLIACFLLVLIPSQALCQIETKGIKELNEIANKLRKANVDSACLYAYEGQSLKSSGSIKERAINSLLCTECYRRDNKWDSAYISASDAIELYTEIGEKKDIAIAKWYMAKVWMGNSDYDRARDYYREAMDNLKQVEGGIGTLFKIKNEVGISFLMEGDLSKGLQELIEALMITEQDESLMIERYRILHNISIVYYQLGDLERALEYNSATIAIPDTLKSRYQDLILDALSNRATMLYTAGKIDSAELNIKKAFQLANEFDIREKSIRLYANYYRNKNDSLAIKYYKILSDFGSLRDGIIPSMRLSEAYSNLDKLDSAAIYAQKAYDLSIDKGLSENIYESAKLLGVYYGKLGQPENANFYLNQALAYQDSILSKESQVKVSDLIVQLETRDKIYEINKLELLSEINRSQKRWLITLVSLLTVISILTYIWFKSKYKLQKVEKRRLEDEIESSKKTLQTQAMSMIRLKNILDEINISLRAVKTKIAETNSTRDIQKLLNLISYNNSLEPEWDVFNQSFTTIHKSFYDDLKNSYPKLTVKELRMCALIRLNMTNYEISSLLNINSKSVIMAKYRLKKKMDLDEEKNLQDFVVTFNK